MTSEPSGVAQPIQRFEDLLRLGDESVLALLRHVENGSLAAALRGAPEGVSDLFYRNMSYRAALMIREYCLGEETTLLSDGEVEEQHRGIVALANGLLESGEATLANPHGPIHPDRCGGPGGLKTLMRQFESILARDAKELASERFDDQWATALHALPESEVEAFLAKIHRRDARRIREAMRVAPPPTLGEVEMARLYIGHSSLPSPEFTVATARTLFGDPDLLSNFPPSFPWIYIRDHRAIMTEAMGAEWVENMEEKTAPWTHLLEKALRRAVKRLFSR